MPVVLDGAMGTELQRRGLDTSLPLWSARALIEAPDEVVKIHQDYVTAGADVLTTNSFRTHRRSLEKTQLGEQAMRLTRLSVELARTAASMSSGAVKVAGSISPLEDCYRPDLSPNDFGREFHGIASHLADAGCDLLLVETMNNGREAEAATRAAVDTGLPVWVSLNPSNADPGRLLSGESLADVAKSIESLGVAAILVNCAPPEVIESALRVLRGAVRTRIGAYSNNGLPDEQSGWRFDSDLPVREFVLHCRRLVEIGADIVGGCCGTRPEHIEALSRDLRSGDRATEAMH